MSKSTRRVFAFLGQFMAPYKWRFIFATLLAVVSSTVALYRFYALAEIVDFMTVYQAGQSLRPIYIILLLIVVTTCIRYIFGFFARYITINIAEKVTVDIEQKAIDHMTRLDMSWHEKENSGNKMQRVQRGVNSMNNFSQLWSGTIVEMVVTFIGTLIILSHFNVRFVGVILLYQIVYFFIASSTRKRGIIAMKAAHAKDEEIAGLWHEIVGNIRSVKVLGMSKKILEYAKEKGIPYLEFIRQRVFWFQLGGNMRSIWEGIALAGFIFFIVLGIADGQYEVGFLVLFTGYFGSITNTVNQLSNAADDIATAKANVGRLVEIFDEPVVIDKKEGKIEFPHDWNSIHIKNLSFRYGTDEKVETVLTDIDFEIKKGEKIGIVGLSGAGKSTLFKLLLKEHENYTGEILIGEVPLQTIKKSSYTEHIAAVLQDTEVFNMSLKSNIILANSKEEDNKSLLEQSLSIAHINDFLLKLPIGVETLIGEKGVKLSGGEKQRLGIARAIFKQPEILFLDEATSHLDVESEQKIQDSLKKFFKNVTAIVIAHRLSTIREMDRIIVIEGGKIIETGTFESLNAKSGRFKEFWDKQN